MPYETDFDSAFTLLLGKAQGVITPTPTPIPITGGGTTTPVAQDTSYVIAFTFGGGGTPLSAATADPVLIEAPDPGEIVWVHLYAGSANYEPVAVTAVLDLQRTRWETFGGTTPVYGSGTSPRITADTQANMSLAGWFAHMDAGDTLIAKLTSFSGTATWLSMQIKVRRESTVLAQSTVVDAAGNQYVDASGNFYVYRN